MRLLRVGSPGNETPAVLDASGVQRDVSSVTADFDPEFFADGGLDRLRHVDLATMPVLDDDVRVGSPVPRPGKIACAGLNYRDHAAESGLSVPDEPVLFFKASNTMVGPNDDVLIPPESTKTDWEVELGIVIGRPARYLVDEAAAHDVIAGFVVSHDVSEREFQIKRGGQWMKGKSAETFNPLGPWLVTPDEFTEPQSARLWLSVNDEIVQDGNTKNMVFSATYLVWYISQFMVLEPGDLINTGTPAGVGFGFTPPRYLRPGDQVRLGIEGLGEQHQHVVQAVR